MAISHINTKFLLTAFLRKYINVLRTCLHIRALAYGKEKKYLENRAFIFLGTSGIWFEGGQINWKLEPQQRFFISEKYSQVTSSYQCFSFRSHQSPLIFCLGTLMNPNTKMECKGSEHCSRCTDFLQGLGE